MPSYSRHDLILVRYPFSDLSSSKVRSAVVVMGVIGQLSPTDAAQFDPSLGYWLGL